MLFLLLLIASSFAADVACNAAANQSGKCLKCDSDATDATCNECMPKNYMDAEKLCHACEASCTACDKDKCTTCPANSSAVKDAPKTCGCDDTFGLPGGLAGGVCTACTDAAGAALCQQCAADNTSCTKCVGAGNVNGLTDGLCAACSAGGTNVNCISCDGNVAQCAECKAGFFLSNSPGVKDTACTECELATGCIACSALKTCSQCEDGKGVSADETENTCEPGTVENCKVFSTKDACTTCNTGFMKTSATVCDACPDNCDKCDANKAECETCSSGFKVKDDKTCEVDPASSAAALVFSFVGLLAMLF